MTDQQRQASEKERQESIRALDEQRFERQRFFVDKNTSNTNTTRVIPVAGRGFGNAVAPLNGERILFKLNDLKNFVWDKSALVLEFYFAQADGVTAVDATANTCPSFIVGKLIQNVQIRLNENSEVLYRSSANDFYDEYYARMITHYNNYELQRHSNIIGPIISGSDSYITSNTDLSTLTNLIQRNTHLLSRKKLHIPLNDIFIRLFSGTFNNVHEIEFEITLANLATICSVVSDIDDEPNLAVPIAEQGRAFITECTMLRYDYRINEEPIRAPITRLGYLTTDSYRMDIPTSDDPSIIREFTIPDVKNLQAIFMYQPARDYLAGDASTIRYALDEEHLLFGTTSLDIDDLRTTHNQVQTANSRFGLYYLQCFYGSEVVPNNVHPFSTTPIIGAGAQCSIELWYYLALNAKGLLGNEERTLGVSKQAFLRTCPFIYLTFGTPGYQRLSEGNNLRIRYSGVHTSGTVRIILFRLKGVEISEGGSVKHLF